MNLNLLVWRQKNFSSQGSFVQYQVTDVSPDMSFLEMLDVLNERLTHEGQEIIEFDSDCREGICGSCGLVINGQAHGPELATTTCQLYMRAFRDGETVVIEPWRAKAFPVIKDLVVDRGALDRIVTSGGFISAKSGKHADANAMLVSKPIADEAMDAAACIGCGACVAACPNASASLFTAAKIVHLNLLPQGQPEKAIRVRRMVEQMDLEGFGNCSNIGECRAACPAEISIKNIAIMKLDYLKSV
jgi:succinate dehydrogenase / fumarate reductase iron-sulfur subunit